MYRFAVLLPLFLTLAAHAGESALPFTAETLPAGWKIRREIVVPGSVLPSFTARFGGTVERLVNQHINVNGLPAQVNLLVGADEESATAIHETLLAARGADFAARRGRDVFEIAGQNVLLARVVRAALGLPSATDATWEVSFRVALVDELLEARRNEVFNLFLAHSEAPGDEGAVAAIRSATQGWTFGSSLRLIRGATPEAEIAWSFDPPSAVAVAETAGVVRYEFEDAPELLGLPYVDVKGKLRVRSRFRPSSPEDEPVGKEGTALWPVDAVRSQALAATAGLEDDGLRVLALLRHLKRRIRHAGAPGSRDPVPVVLERGYARCFDRSDVLVAMCRSLGIPARIVAGWVPPLGAGHVWTEVHLAGEGWIPVDATTTWLGASLDYLPFFRTDSGPLPFVYLSMPRIRRVD